MKYESLSFHGNGDKGRVSIEGDARWPSNRTSQAHDSKRAPAPNWAWAHSTDSYDWMDSHSPFPPSDLSG